ncbi:hypothetical protein [Acinetobacter baumannii]|uniref:hypothetical protein n=1 Tax=Acinetobacter baumannii TaxID=470 RepID=UPI001C0C7B23|nr:hypothetical protein [Acinetobacter baumannii]MBU3081223.1 hypothetical protein [Acinetobacter baumannii]MDC4427977.1 hypothetical protein [Acinetobacter baumannii]MDC5144891.1 hypothetical protein [Acinetobacter baumannii]
MSLVKKFEGSDMGDIENQINQWISDCSKTKQDQITGRVISGRKIRITQTETIYIENRGTPFNVLVTYEYA